MNKATHSIKYIFTPYISLYNIQWTSLLSIFMRISGFSLIFFLIILAHITLFDNYFISYYISSIFNIFHDMTSFFSTFIFFIIYFLINYHIIFGLKYILSLNIWNYSEFKQYLNINYYYQMASYSWFLLIFISSNFGAIFLFFLYDL